MVLTWEGEADVDLILANDDNPICSPGACTYENCLEDSFDQPDWDGSGTSSDGDPTLYGIFDDVVGPEFIELLAPGPSTYVIGVHHFSLDSDPIIANVEIFIDGQWAGGEQRSLAAGDFWFAGRVAWSTTEQIVAFDDSVLADFNCSALGGDGCWADWDCPDDGWPNSQYCDFSAGGGSLTGTCTLGCRDDSVCPADTICLSDRSCGEAPGGDDGPGDRCGWSDACEEGLDCRPSPTGNVCVERCNAPGDFCDDGGNCCDVSGLPYCVPLGPAGFTGECSCSPSELRDYSCL